MEEVILLDNSSSTPNINNCEESKSVSDLNSMASSINDGTTLSLDKIVDDGLIDSNIIDSMYAFNLKVAENSMYNSNLVIQKLEKLVRELSDRLSDTSDLSDDDLINRIGVLFEIQSRYSMMIEKIITNTAYTSFIDNLSALKRMKDSYKSSANIEGSIYDPEIDRRALKTIVSELTSLVSTSTNYNELSGVGNNE